MPTDKRITAAVRQPERFRLGLPSKAPFFAAISGRLGVSICDKKLTTERRNLVPAVRVAAKAKADNARAVLVAINELLDWDFLSHQSREQLLVLKAELKDELRAILAAESVAKAA